MAAENAVPSARRQIVVVDHDLEALRRLVAPLRAEYEFHLTISASEALALLSRFPVVAIVAGQRLFSSSGLEVLTEARKRAPRATRILLAEGSDRRMVEDGATNAGLFQILQRPCTSNQLKEALHAAARSAEARTEETGEVEHVVMETAEERPQATDVTDVPLTVLTTDAQLFDAITAAVQGRHETFLATRLEDAGELAVTGRCPVLITDQALAQPALERITRHLRTHESALVTIAVGSREQGNALMGMLSSGVIHRFLLKPVTPGLARLAIDSASRQHLSLKAHPRTDPIVTRAHAKHDPVVPREPANRPRELAPHVAAEAHLAAPTVPEQLEPAGEPAFVLMRDDRPMHPPPGAGKTGEFGKSRPFPPSGLVVGALLALVAAGAAAWWFTRERAPQIDPREAAIAANLASAQKAIDAGALVSPPDASAAHFYAEVISLDPQNAVAHKGLDDLAVRFIEQAETLIVEGQLDEAANALAAVRQVRPEHRRLRFLDTQLRKEQQDRLVLRARESASAGDLRGAQQLLDQAAKVSPGTAGDAAEVNAAQATIAERERAQAVGRSLDAARQRVSQGRLVGPPNDSAKFHLLAARRADPDNIAVQQGVRDLGTRVTAEANQAIERNQFDAARTWIAEAQSLGVPETELTPLRQSLETGVRDRPKNELLQLVLRRTEENRLLEPAEDSARHHLARLVQLDPQFSGLRRGIDALGARLVANAQAATSQRQFDAAARMLSEARSIGYGAAELAAAETTLRTAREPIPFPPRIPQEVLPKRVTYVAPVYPRQALETGSEGWVDVSFAVNTAGNVTDASIESASRRGLFDRAALTAVRQWKFEPRPGLDPAFEQRIRTRVEFKLKD